MNIHQYACFENNHLRVSREQASEFAKGVAGDFNPIHDAEAKKFCVPGDLLFTAVLHRYGVSKHMRFEFEGMVNDGTRLILPDSAPEQFSLRDEAGKNYMNVIMTGEHSGPETWVSDLAENYVQFSGRAFPHILVDLMKTSNVMINPMRPLVIYRNMSIDLEHFPSEGISLGLTDARLDIDGKKGLVSLAFSISSGDHEVGHGTKNMVLSGLREYDQTQMDLVISNYNESKARYLATQKSQD